MIDRLKIIGTHRRCRLRAKTEKSQALRWEAKKLCRSGFGLPSGIERIYFHHIPKVAGCSIISSFIGGELSGFDALVNSRFGLQFFGERPFVYFDHYQLEQGSYYFGSSHFPKHFLSLPSSTFELTCLRDPIERVVSLYRMATALARKEENGNLVRKWLGAQASWLGVPFGEHSDVVSFAQRMPRRFLWNQIYMFSKSLEVSEAVEGVINLDAVMFQDRFQEGIDGVSKKLGIELISSHVNQGTGDSILSASQREALTVLLAPEYRFYDQVRKALIS